MAADLVGAGGLVGAVLVAEVLVGFHGLCLAGVRLIHGRDIVAQGDGLDGLVDTAADALAHLRRGRRRLAGGCGAGAATVGADLCGQGRGGVCR